MANEIAIEIEQSPMEFEVEQHSLVNDLDITLECPVTNFEVEVITNTEGGMQEVYHTPDFTGTGNQSEPLGLSSQFLEGLDDRFDAKQDKLTAGPGISVSEDAVIQTTTYVHDQAEAAQVWTIVHNMNKFPNVNVVDSSGSDITCKRTWVDENTVRLEMNAPFKGKAYLN